MVKDIDEGDREVLDLIKASTFMTGPVKAKFNNIDKHWESDNLGDMLVLFLAYYDNVTFKLQGDTVTVFLPSGRSNKPMAVISKAL